VKSLTIGYLIPEFPGQTHNFFWRERQALQDHGVGTWLISTRRPPRGIVSPSWATQAEAETDYLFPLTVAETINVLLILLLSGPRAWYRCLACVFEAQGLSVASKLRLVGLFPFAAKLVMLAKRHGWSHLHVHSCGDSANIALFASLMSELTYSLTLHNPLSVYGGNQNGKWAHASFAVVITRKIHEEVIQEIGSNLPREIAIAPMGVDVEKFVRGRPYEPYRGEGSLNLFSCGRLNPAKGYVYLLSAIKSLLEQGVDVSLTIAGEDEQGGSGYRRVLEKQIQEQGLGKSVILLGPVSEEAVRECLELTHAFVLASTAEPLGVVLMEAMAMNVPVIATNAGGVPELVSAGEDGLLIPPTNVHALVDAILELAGNPELTTCFSRVARTKIVESFSHRRSAQVIARLLRETMHPPRLDLTTS
jgi:glycosyltransferase involved in cell wall biosynthesis